MPRAGGRTATLMIWWKTGCKRAVTCRGELNRNWEQVCRCVQKSSDRKVCKSDVWRYGVYADSLNHIHVSLPSIFSLHLSLSHSRCKEEKQEFSKHIFSLSDTSFPLRHYLKQSQFLIRAAPRDQLYSSNNNRGYHCQCN